jgi:hypothetical protein
MDPMTAHNASTEALLIISSTVFYIVLFLIMKHGLVDKRGMLSSKARVRSDASQISAVFFTIFVLIALFMLPIDSYEYSHYVIPLTYIIMITVVGYEVYVLFSVGDGDGYDIESKLAPSSSTGTTGATGATGASASPASMSTSTSSFWSSRATVPKRPVNF